MSLFNRYGINDVSITISSSVSASRSRIAVEVARDGDDYEGNGEASNASRCDDSCLTGRDGRIDSTTIPGDPYDPLSLAVEGAERDDSHIHRTMCIPVIVDLGSGDQVCNLA